MTQVLPMGEKRNSQDKVSADRTTTLLPLMLWTPLGMTRPSGSPTSWVQRRAMTVTGGCSLRLSLMHMVRKGSWARSSLRKPPNNYPGIESKTPPALLLPLETLSPSCSDPHFYNKINSRWAKNLSIRKSKSQKSLEGNLT